MGWACHVVRMGERRSAHRGLVVKPEETVHLEDTSVDRRIFKKWDVVMDWIHLAQDRERRQDLVNVVMNFRVTENAGNFLTSCGSLTCSRSTLLYGLIS